MTDTSLAGRILVVDDERNIRRTLRMVLEGEGATVFEAATGEEALAVLDGGEPIEVVITDVMMPGTSGLELLEHLSGAGGGTPDVPVILISGHATVDDAVKATRLGAFDFFEKPLARDRVIVSVRNALRQFASDAQMRKLRSRIRGEIIGGSAPVASMLAQIAKVGSTKARVLVTGESGSGKELVARAIHEASDRRNAEFVKVNCAAIPRELIESELFGHERGAFTGATAQKKGLFEVASGGNKLVEVDVRVLAATHRNLSDQVAASEFREDLFFRLNVVPIHVPPLRDRVADIPLLARHFIDLAARENGVAPKRLSPEALDALRGHDWPGNIRELRNVMERMVILSDGDIDLEDVPDEVRGSEADDAAGDDSLLDLNGGAVPDGMTLREFREAVERAFILKRLVENDWNVSRTATSLGVERTHLHKKMKLLGIQRGS